MRSRLARFTRMIEQLEAKERAKLRLQALKARFARQTEEKAVGVCMRV